MGIKLLQRKIYFIEKRFMLQWMSLMSPQQQLRGNSHIKSQGLNFFLIYN